MKNKPQWRLFEISLAACVLAVAILLFWWRIWAPSSWDIMHFSDDIFVKDYPARLGLFRLFMEGHFPLWDPYQFGGWPGIANCEAGFFYPLNWVLIPFVNNPPAAFWATEWLVLFHFFIAGFGMYRLGRYLGLSPLGAMMAAIVFTFCGFHSAHKKHTNLFFALVWFPWLLLLAEKWVREQKFSSLFFFSLLLSLAYLAGHPQVALYMTIILFSRLMHAIFLLSKTNNQVNKTFFIKKSVLISLCILFSFSLSAVQWIPTWNLIQQSERIDANQFQRSTEFSMPPFELFDLLFPEAVYPQNQVEVFYWGMIPLFLTIFALFACSLNSFYWFLVFIGFISILLAMGEYIFFYDISYLLIPGVAWVRAPSRWIYFAGLPMSLLSGLAIQKITTSWEQIKNGDSFALLIKVFIFLLAVISVLSLVITGLFREEARLAFVSSLTFTFLFTLIFLFVAYLLYSAKISPRTFAVIMILLAWLDLGTRYRMLDLSPGIGGYVMDKEVKNLRELGWNYRTKVFFKGGGERTLYHGAAQDFHEVDGQSPLTPLIHLQVRKDTALDAFKRPNAALLDLFGVKTILTDLLTQIPPDFTRNTDRLFLNPSPAVRARLLHESLWVDEETQRPLLALESFPFDRVALTADNKANNRAENQKNIDPILSFPKPYFAASCSGNALCPTAFLIIDGKNQWKDFSRQSGYFISIADMETGEIEETRVFDLNLDYDPKTDSIKNPPQQNLQMTDFIHSIPQGKKVFLAIGNNATNVMLEDTILALRSIGASIDVRKQYRMAHVIIGEKGAPVSSAREIISSTEAFILNTGTSVMVQGDAGKKVNLVASSQFAKEWRSLLLKYREYEFESHPMEQSDSHGEKPQDISIPAPIMLYSCPKKEGVYDQDFASILIKGKEQGLNHRGYNLVVMNPVDGRVIQSDAFDITSDWDPQTNKIKEPPVENRRMQEFINKVPDNCFILGTIRDEALDLLQPDTVQVLHEQGSTITVNTEADLRKHFSHAFFMVKGATYCVESFARNQDSIVFTRLDGEPNLVSSNIISKDLLPDATNPADEIYALSKQNDKGKEHSSGETYAVRDMGPNQFSVTGMFPADGLLFVSEVFYPGWKAFMDGEEQPIQRLDYFFRGVRVTQGIHAIQFLYDPPEFRLGVSITLFSILICGIGFVLFWLRIFR